MTIETSSNSGAFWSVVLSSLVVVVVANTETRRNLDDCLTLLYK